MTDNYDTTEVKSGGKKIIATLKAGNPRENARVFRDCRDTPLIYYRGDWNEWRDTHYHQISKDAVIAELYDFLAKSQVRSKVTDADGNEQWLAVPFNPDDRDVRKVLDALMHLKPKVFVSEELDAPGWLRGQGCKPDPKNLVAMSNGIIHLGTGQLMQHTPDFLTMTALPFAFDPEAKCERWEQFVEEIFPNEATRREFQKAIGYTLSSDQSQQKMFLMLGPARAGKGVTLRVLSGLLGRENAVSPKLSQLRGDFGLWQLIDKKAALFPDERLGKDTLPIVDKLLSISGEDDVSINRKNKSFWLGRLAIKVWIATNTMPGFEDASSVIVSRFIMFRLTRSFLGKEDTGLTDALLGELPGILNWAIDGLRMLREDGHFNQPLEAEDAIERMRDIAAPIRRFVKDRMVLAEDRSVELQTAYSDYKRGAEENGNKALSKGKFLTAIMDGFSGIKHKYEGRRGQLRIEKLLGAALRQSADDATDDNVIPIERARRISGGQLDG